ncbi:hypothetical protein NIES2104_34280 [Leptolyngbya sp. NIES-2104]|nr:hypothetical protein NIES2104_34280 [Leptolyngbya sp. NIES-2104]
MKAQTRSHASQGTFPRRGEWFEDNSLSRKPLQAPRHHQTKAR